MFCVSKSIDSIGVKLCEHGSVLHLVVSEFSSSQCEVVTMYLDYLVFP